MGGGYTHDDLLEIQSKGAPLAEQIPWIRPEHTKPGSSMPNDRTAVVPGEAVAKSAKAMLMDHREELAGEGQSKDFQKGEVWYFGMK